MSAHDTGRDGRLNVAVIFGGASQEHDVSVVSAQQLMDAADARHIRVIPVYMDFENRLFTGVRLRDISAFRPRPPGLEELRFRWGDDGPELVTERGSIQPVDCALPVFHGPFGEDGRIHGMLELVGVPVTGFSASASAIAMRKDATKTLVQSVGVRVLDHVSVSRAQRGAGLGAVLEAAEARLGLPVVVKPANLGSSIGVGLARTRAEIAPLVEYVLRQDDLALIEPQVRNLVEYNIAMMWRGGEVVFSAIERPKSGAELLDFREKYLSGGGTKGAVPSEGMLSLTREIDPDMPDALRQRIHDFARRAFMVLGARGAPRIDFMCDSATGDLWFNEINPIPGSYGFFLWEAAQTPLLYPELIDHLVAEAMHTSRKRFDDPVPQGAWLLPR